MKKDPSSAAQAEKRRLAAIMFTDIVGFSRQMGSNETRTLRLLEVHNEIIQQAVAEHHGTVIKTVGDAFLVDFPSVVNAVQCAQQIQRQFRAHNAEKDSTDQIHVRIGIHLGDIVQKDGDVFGDGVNIASRLQGLAKPDTICLSQAVYKEIEKKLPVDTVISLGKPKLKNIAQRERVYALLPEPPRGVRQRLQVQRLKLMQWRRTLQIAAVVLVLVWAGVVTLRSFRSSPPPGHSQGIAFPESRPALPLPDKPSLVVLPFANMSKDPEQDYFSDGITEDLTSDLSKFSSLFVIARNSAFTYKGKAVKVQDVSKELGVRYVLEGSVRKADSQVRVTAQLIDATTGGHLWSERYDRPLRDIFALQDEIVQQLVANLRVEVLEAELTRVRRVPTENLTAYEALLRGWESFLRLSQETNGQARQMFEKAIELDPAYAQAYVGLGYTYWQEWPSQWSQDPKTLEHALMLAQKARELDGSLPQVYLLLSDVYLFQKQHDQAIAAAERAIALAPSLGDGYSRLGHVLHWAGRPEEAIGWLAKARRLDPRNPVPYLISLAESYRLLRRYEEAIATYRRALQFSANLIGPHFFLAVIYSELGREAEARAEVEEVLRISPNFSLEVVRRRLPFKDPAEVERCLVALRKAGLK